MTGVGRPLRQRCPVRWTTPRTAVQSYPSLEVTCVLCAVRASCLSVGWQGEMEDARSLYLRAISVGTRTLGSNHPSVAAWRDSLSEMDSKVRRSARLGESMGTVFREGNTRACTSRVVSSLKSPKQGLRLQVELYLLGVMSKFIHGRLAK